ncbi:oxygenase-like protein [Lasiosphaeris hirsuta]|uniref:Oxygenase-like protein n=1 Tax=Lasiosphaeris hirsuta TaxID=260670 RepID=A0AA40EBI9_9PEZI|nr:oxygenase-like protein [Lasiosphaeris hirsuta]
MGEQKNTLPQVAIIGAGVCGLILAQGLQKNGYEVVVYEKEKYIGEKPREWTMIIHWALPTLRKMLPDEILDDLPSAYADPSYPYNQEKETIPFFNGLTGDLQFEVAAPFRRMSRTRLRKACAKGLDIRCGKGVVDLQVGGSEGPVTIVLEDGETATADLVVGADGAKSRIRPWLVGEEASKPTASEFAIANGIVKYESAEKSEALRSKHPVCSVSITPGEGMILIASKSDPSTYSFQIVRSWRGQTDFLEGPEAVEKIKEVTANPAIHDPFRSAVHWIQPDSARFVVSQMHYWATVPWDSRGGRVILAGDAAHSVLPNRGQGLNHALADVSSLINELVKVKEEGITLQAAIKAYEDDIFVRGRKAALESVEDAGAVMKEPDMKKSRFVAQGLSK